MEYDNNHFIIASRAYSLHSNRTCIWVLMKGPIHIYLHVPRVMHEELSCTTQGMVLHIVPSYKTFWIGK
jgi:hypothetical protein